MAGYDNIKYNTIHSAEVARERGANGGRASGVTKRNRKTLREDLKYMLASAIPKSSPHYKRVVKMMSDLGIKRMPTVQDLTTLGLITRATKDHAAFIALRDTIGEKPVETYEDLTPKSPIILGTIPAEMVEKAKKEREERNQEADKNRRNL